MELKKLGRFYQSIIIEFDKIQSPESKDEVVNLIQKILFREEVERQRKELIKSLNKENDKLKKNYFNEVNSLENEIKELKNKLIL